MDVWIYNNQIAQYGDGYSFTWKATGHTLLSKDELKELTQRINNQYGTKVKLSAAAVIHNQLINIDDSKVSSSGTSGYAFKYKGKWYCLNIESL